MKVLILEDNPKKSAAIELVIQAVQPAIATQKVDCFSDFFKYTQREKYDLIVVDLLVPRFAEDDETHNVTDDIIEATRDHQCINFRTPVIAITQFQSAAEDNFENLNHKDIHIVTYKEEDDRWKETLQGKVKACIECQSYDFIVICALPKEAEGFSKAGFTVGEFNNLHGMECRRLELENLSGLIITLPRMGLVNCAITTSRAIDIFKPKLVCMSGICAGVKGEVEIYDVVIPDSCQQHDYGKWGVNGFEPESYTVQIAHETKLIVRQLADDQEFNKQVSDSIKPKRNQIPEYKEYFDFKILTAHSSSGSAVIADDKIVALIRDQHRKTKTFEMESYAVYEAARLSSINPIFFSAKAVVDNGDAHKGDDFHELACILASTVTCELIRRSLKK